MSIWAFEAAKAQFSEFLESCLRDGPQMMTKDGDKVAVLVPVDEWRRLRRAAGPTFESLLLSEWPRWDLQPPKRGQQRRRAPLRFD
jgi:antitoxin Phd